MVIDSLNLTERLPEICLCLFQLAILTHITALLHALDASKSADLNAVPDCNRLCMRSFQLPLLAHVSMSHDGIITSFATLIANVG